MDPIQFLSSSSSGRSRGLSLLLEQSQYPKELGMANYEHNGTAHLYVYLLPQKQSISQDLEIGRPNLLFFEKQGVQIFNLQYFCMCIADKTGCPFSKQVVQKTPKGGMLRR